MTALLSPTYVSPTQPTGINHQGENLPGTDLPGDALLNEIDLTQLAQDLDAVRDTIRASLGSEDAAYIRKLIRAQRLLDLAGRCALVAGIFPPAWLAGVTMLSLAKILENMEIGHNVIHGQYDWMQDSEIHSPRWEWAHACPTSQWKHSHNFEHHQWTNVLGKDRDVGYGFLRVSEHQEWAPRHLAQPVLFVLLAIGFDYGISFHDVVGELERTWAGESSYQAVRSKATESIRKILRLGAKDFVATPLLALPCGPAGMLATLTGTITANVVRNLWSFTVIFCGHFPDEVQLFSAESVAHETPGGWYARQILGSANFSGGKLMHLLTGNLDHQIEHHLFPDLPASRYAEAATEVQAICAKHGIQYNTGSFLGQFTTVVKKVFRLSLPWS